MRDEKLCVSVKYMTDIPESKNRARFEAYRQLSRDLFDFLISNKQEGFSLFFREEEDQIMYLQNEYRAWFEVFQVKREQMPIKIIEYKEMDWHELSSTALGEIKRRIVRFFRSPKGRRP